MKTITKDQKKDCLDMTKKPHKCKLIVSGKEYEIDLDALNNMAGGEYFVDGDCGRATECVEIDPPKSYLEGTIAK